MKTKLLPVITAFAFLSAISLAGCGIINTNPKILGRPDGEIADRRIDPPVNSNNQSNGNGQNQIDKSIDVKSQPIVYSFDSPAATFVSFNNARRQKNLPKLSRTLARDVVLVMQIHSTMSGHGDDYALQKMAEKPLECTDETRNEMMIGSTGSVECRTEVGLWKRINFVKEDGDWKILIPTPPKAEKKS